MPFEKLHTCRIRESWAFEEGSIRTTERESDGKKYFALLGRLKGDETLTEQSFRYPIESWSTTQAKKHCKEHGGELFEPAQKESATNQQIIGTPLLLPEVAALELLSRVDSGFDCDEYDKIGLGVVTKENKVILQINGLLMFRPSFLARIHGAIDIEEIESEFDTLLDDESIEKIVLEINSPGGSVEGIESFAEKIFAARGKKKIVSVIRHTATSAAYWLAAATEKIILKSKLDNVGGIGVVAIHRDFSQREKQEGIKTTEIIAGKFKAAGSPHRPLDDKGKSTLQEKVDFIYDIFISAVSKFREIDRENLLAVADGKVFLGPQAIENGLADVFFDEIMEEKNKMADNKDNKELTRVLTVDIIKAESPEIYKQIYANGIKDGIEQEKARVQEIRGLSLPGFEALTDTAIATGLSSTEYSQKLLSQVKEKGLTTQALQAETVITTGAHTQTSNDEQKEREIMAANIAAGANARKR